MMIGQFFFLTGKKDLYEQKKRKSLSNFNFSFSSIENRQNKKLIIISSLILIIFWASFEQAGD